MTVEGCGKDLAHEGRQPRPQRRRQSGGVPPGAARQRALRVPQHRRPQDEHVEGQRRGGTRDGGPAAAGAAALPLPAPQAATGSRVRPGGRRHPGALRRVRPRSPRPRPACPCAGELPADPERIFRASLVDADADAAVEAARFRPAFRHLALLVQVPGVDLEARVAAEKGAPLDDAERAILAERARVARTWLDGFAPDRYQVAVRDDLPAEVGGLTEAQALYMARPGRRRGVGGPRLRRRLAGPHLPRRPGPRRLVARCVRGRVRGLPGARQRAARRLAAGEPGAPDGGGPTSGCCRRGHGRGRRADRRAGRGGRGA